MGVISGLYKVFVVRGCRISVLDQWLMVHGVWG